MPKKPAQTGRCLKQTSPGLHRLLYEFFLTSSDGFALCYFVSSIMISLLLATNLLIASGSSGACWI
ncbi:MAG: hypothetical protein K2G19_00540, partial [Lachnospiraceae bacterium]|nr:hypothetical protein [Lachnospiraceae bacterium]